METQTTESFTSNLSLPLETLNYDQLFPSMESLDSTAHDVDSFTMMSREDSLVHHLPHFPSTNSFRDSTSSPSLFLAPSLTEKDSDAASEVSTSSTAAPSEIRFLPLAALQEHESGEEERPPHLPRPPSSASSIAFASDLEHMALQDSSPEHQLRSFASPSFSSTSPPSYTRHPFPSQQQIPNTQRPYIPQLRHAESAHNISAHVHPGALSSRGHHPYSHRGHQFHHHRSHSCSNLPIFNVHGDVGEIVVPQAAQVQPLAFGDSDINVTVNVNLNMSDMNSSSGNANGMSADLMNSGQSLHPIVMVSPGRMISARGSVQLHNSKAYAGYANSPQNTAAMQNMLSPPSSYHKSPRVVRGNSSQNLYATPYPMPLSHSGHLTPRSLPSVHRSRSSPFDNHLSENGDGGEEGGGATVSAEEFNRYVVARSRSQSESTAQQQFAPVIAAEYVSSGPSPRPYVPSHQHMPAFHTAKGVNPYAVNPLNLNLTSPRIACPINVTSLPTPRSSRSILSTNTPRSTISSLSNVSSAATPRCSFISTPISTPRDPSLTSAPLTNSPCFSARRPVSSNSFNGPEEDAANGGNNWEDDLSADSDDDELDSQPFLVPTTVSARVPTLPHATFTQVPPLSLFVSPRAPTVVRATAVETVEHNSSVSPPHISISPHSTLSPVPALSPLNANLAMLKLQSPRGAQHFWDGRTLPSSQPMSGVANGSGMATSISPVVIKTERPSPRVMNGSYPTGAALTRLPLIPESVEPVMATPRARIKREESDLEESTDDSSSSPSSKKNRPTQRKANAIYQQRFRDRVVDLLKSLQQVLPPEERTVSMSRDAILTSAIDTVRTSKEQIARLEAQLQQKRTGNREPNSSPQTSSNTNRSDNLTSPPNSSRTSCAQEPKHHHAMEVSGADMEQLDTLNHSLLMTKASLPVYVVRCADMKVVDANEAAARQFHVSRQHFLSHRPDGTSRGSLSMHELMGQVREIYQQQLAQGLRGCLCIELRKSYLFYGQTGDDSSKKKKATKAKKKGSEVKIEQANSQVKVEPITLETTFWVWQSENTPSGGQSIESCWIFLQLS